MRRLIFEDRAGKVMTASATPYVKLLVLPAGKTEIHRQFRTPQAKSEDCTGFLITGKASDARLPKSRGMRRTYRYAAVTRDEGNAADDVLMVDQGRP